MNTDQSGVEIENFVTEDTKKTMKVDDENPEVVMKVNWCGSDAGHWKHRGGVYVKEGEACNEKESVDKDGQIGQRVFIRE